MANFKLTQVTKQFEKTFDDGNTSYSFKTEATGDMWIRAGKERYAGIVEEGNLVNLTTSEAKKRGSDVITVYCDKVELAQAASKPAQAKGAASAPSGDWANRQSSIEYQSARNAAIDYLKLVVGSNAIKLPEAPAKKLKALDVILDAYTAQFYTDVALLGALKRVSQSEDKDEQDVPSKSATPEDDDE